MEHHQSGTKVGAEGKRRILGYLGSNITGCVPRQFGKALKGDLGASELAITGRKSLAEPERSRDRATGGWSREG